MAASENKIAARRLPSFGWYVVLALVGTIAVFVYDVAIFLHPSVQHGIDGWALYYIGPVCVLGLSAFLIGRSFRETRRAYWINAFVISAAIPAVVWPPAITAALAAMLYPLFWPEWHNWCDPYRPHPRCFLSSQKVRGTQDGVEVGLAFGLLNTPPDATVTLSQLGDTTTFRELTGVAIRLGEGSYNSLTCEIASQGPTNGGWSRVQFCRISGSEAVLSPQEPDTLTVRFSYGQDSYERTFTLKDPRRVYAGYLLEERKTKSR